MSNITNWQNSRNESFLIVQVDKDKFGFCVNDFASRLIYSELGNSLSGGEIELPQIEQDYTLILDLDNATDEQAVQVVDVEGYADGGYPVFKDYEEIVHDFLPYNYSNPSLHSLARSLKLDTENYNHVFLKIEQ